MFVWTATVLAAGAVSVYGLHELCAATARNAHEHWKREQEYQPKRNRDEEYHFEKMDDAAYHAAESSAEFWLGTAKVCPKAVPRPQKPKIPVGGGGT